MTFPCRRCDADGASARVCEHVLEWPLVTWRPDASENSAMMCTRCAEEAAPEVYTVCSSCLSDLRASALTVDSKDLARGFAIPSLPQAETLWGEMRHPIPKALPDRWAKVTFSAVPVVLPRHLESMWLRIDKRTGSSLLGMLDNEPGVVGSLELGQRIEFDASQVSGVGWQQQPTRRDSDHTCEICEPDLRRKRQELDEGDEGLLASVRRYGYHVLSIGADDEGPGFAYTIGLAHLFDHPELIVFGLDVEPLGNLIGQLGEAVCAGERFDHDREDAELFENASVRFVPVQRDGGAHYEDYLGYGCWFHSSRDYPVRQVLWSDRAGRFPGDPLFDPRLTDAQPRLDG